MAGRQQRRSAGDEDECGVCGCIWGDEEDVSRHDDIEECPLLDGNSDDESVSRKELDWLAPGSRLEIEQPILRFVFRIIVSQ